MKKILEYVMVGLVTISTLFIGLLFYGVVQASGGKSEDWDKSSLSFVGSCDETCQKSKVKVCNGSDSQDMQGSVNYNVYYAVSGNAKNGSVVESGVIPALKSGECFTIEFDSTTTGNYMVQAYQRDGHPGTGRLWSEACTLVCEVPEEEEEEEPPVEECPATVVVDKCEYTLVKPS